MPAPLMTTEAQRQREQHAADRLLERGPALLESIESSSYIYRKARSGSQALPPPPPAFRPEEISLGKLLGTGGFAIVHEVRTICLDHEEEEDGEENVKEMDDNDATKSPAAVLSDCGDHQHLDNKEKVPKEQKEHNGNPLGDDPESSDGEDSGAHRGREREAAPANHCPQQQRQQSTMGHHRQSPEQRQERKNMERKAVRMGSGRYAIKRLKGSLTVLERARGQVDLAVEARYLAAVRHPGIIKLRGVAAGNPLEAGYFLLLDRLVCTLDQRINEWKRRRDEYSGGFLGLGRKKTMLKGLLVDRMTVAYDLAAAFFYLHENRIVYRDIKPENIGFDFRGDCKVFDFGLCKSLSSELKAKDGGYGYRLTGRAGSLPYMAVEVIRMETYDTKCDCYSFAFLLWEMLCLQQAFKGLSPTEFVERVVVNRERPPLPKDKGAIPPLTRLVLPQAWDHDPRRRPDMKRIAILIRGDLNNMTTDEDVLNRTKHMDERSVESLGSDPESDHPKAPHR